MARNFILDTSVVRLILQEQNDPIADYYWNVIKNAQWWIPFVVYGELYGWALHENLSQKKLSRINKFLQNGELIDFTTDIAKNYGRIIYHLNSKIKSTKKYQNDAWIAACATHNDFYLVTHDKHFDNLLPLINIYPRCNIDIA